MKRTCWDKEPAGILFAFFNAIKGSLKKSFRKFLLCLFYITSLGKEIRRMINIPSVFTLPPPYFSIPRDV